MDWGEFEIHRVSDGTLWLDGGAMFGVVPKALWQKLMPPDELNRIRLGLNCLVLKTPGGTVLIDTGCGDKFTEKERGIYRLEQDPGLLAGLANRGLGPEDIDIVVNTHLHFDHAGGNTRRVDDELVPVFPNATHYVQARELADAESANERTRASYFPENWRPLQERGQLQPIEGVCEILPGIVCEPTPGHTLGHQSVRIESGGKSIYFMADLCPTRSHVPLAWIMGYDLFPLTTLETRRAVYRRAVEEDWLILYEHDADTPWGRIVMRDGKYAGIAQEGIDDAGC